MSASRNTKNSLIFCQQPGSKIYYKPGKAAYIDSMSNALSPPLPYYDEDAAGMAAVNKSRTNKLGVPHAEIREWLLEIAAGNFDAKPPVSRKL